MSRAVHALMIAGNAGCLVWAYSGGFVPGVVSCACAIGALLVTWPDKPDLRPKRCAHCDAHVALVEFMREGAERDERREKEGRS